METQPMTTDTGKAIAEAYRWQRRLGNPSMEAACCHIVANPAYPQVWDANHADAVTAKTDLEIASVFAAMDARLGHTPWRVVHTDCFTPDAFLGRLALDGFQEQPVTIQMVLQGELSDRGALAEIRPVVDDTDWGAMHRLVALDHAEGRRTANLELTPEFTTSVVAGYRSKSAQYHFNLVIQDGEPVAYGAYAIAPNGVGMIEDLFTLQTARRRGVATAMIAAFSDRLRASGCRLIFLGALASEHPKHLYARLGFRPEGLARSWVMEKLEAT
jgi:GNAT superfamily N-acetyltransferase